MKPKGSERSQGFPTAARDPIELVGNNLPFDITDISIAESRDISILGSMDKVQIVAGSHIHLIAPLWNGGTVDASLTLP